MRRALLVLLVLTTTTAATAVPSPPASAAATPPRGVCAGVGGMHTSAPITDVGFGALQTVSWTLTFVFGGCATADGDLVTFTATGVLTGWCDLSSGYGETSLGHRFSWVGVGHRHFYTGEITGEAPFAPEALSGESCVLGADSFLVGFGGSLLWECTVDGASGTQPTFGDLALHYRICA